MEEREYELGEKLLANKKADIPKISYSNYTLWNSLNLSLTAAGLPIPNIDNICRILEGLEQYKNIVWYDTFHHKYRTEWGSDKVRDWQDVDEINLTRIMQSDVGISKVGYDTVRLAVQSTAYETKKNEPLDWLNTLPAWDGIDRMQYFLPDCFGAEQNEYTMKASGNFWIGLVARIFEPGCKLDTMIILEGPQGNLKSTALGIIGGNWFTECHESVKNKDFYQIIQGHLIVELAELDSLGNAEATRVKAMLSNQCDNFRSPYGRLPEKKPRQCVFVGTTNEHTYLRDVTGARRMWPIATGQIRLDLIKENRNQLFAEAVQKYKAGATWWEMPKSAIAEQESRRQIDVWEAIVAEYLILQTEVTISEVLTSACKVEIGKQDRAAQMRVAHCLRIAKWRRVRKLRNGVLQSIWYPET